MREPLPPQLAPGARALMRAMYAGVAQYDREELLAAMRAGKLRAAKEGRWAGGSLPYGLRLEVTRAPGRAKPVKRLVPRRGGRPRGARNLHALRRGPVAEADRRTPRRARRGAPDGRLVAAVHCQLHAPQPLLQGQGGCGGAATRRRTRGAAGASTTRRPQGWSPTRTTRCLQSCRPVCGSGAPGCARRTRRSPRATRDTSTCCARSSSAACAGAPTPASPIGGGGSSTSATRWPTATCRNAGTGACARRR